MVKVIKVGGKLVKLYVIGRMTWLILGMGYKRINEKHYMKLLDLDFETAFELGAETANEFIHEARQGWSYMIGWI